jgi:dTDP-4-amino-4,6-dideoxygalactose transaminase
MSSIAHRIVGLAEPEHVAGARASEADGTDAPAYLSPALHQARAAEAEPLAVSKPSLGEREAAAAAETVLSGRVAQGPQVAAFEAEFASFVGASHACAVSSCTAALHVALYALGVGPGDEVVTVSHSFIATANAVRFCGAAPVFVDIDPATYDIDPERIEAALSPRTRALLVVHQMGLPCDLARILPIAMGLKLPVIEDAASAAGSEIRCGNAWERIGRPHGTVACFSFHPRHVLTTGDGGMLTTFDPELDRKFRRLRQHGMSVTDRERQLSGPVIFEEYPVLGFDYRLTDIQAAVGRVQLSRLPELLARRREIARRYTRALQDVPGLELRFVPDWARPNFQSYAVRVRPEFALSRDALIHRLLDCGISTRGGVMNAHQEGAYAGMPLVSLPHSESARDTVILLPLFHDMTDADVERVLSAIRSAAASPAAA